VREKCKQYLNQLLIDAKQNKNKQHKQPILGLKPAVENQQCFILVKQAMKLHTSGGLTHIIAPTSSNTPKWIPITKVDTMEQHLVEYSQTYFWQVHGTLYTIPPLSQLLQYNALMDFGEAIHEGTTQIDELEIEDVMKLFLKHQHCKMTPTEKSEHLLEFKRLMQGYHKWPECTSTSPSGQHLGIYKSLLKDFPPEPSSDYKP